MTRKITLENAKGYATEANLVKAIEKAGLDTWDGARSYVICRKPDGKWTAIFVIDMNKGGYIGYPADKGFFAV